MTKMKKKAFICILLILSSYFSVYSQSNAVEIIESMDSDDDVMSLSEIEKLIRDTDYNEALFQLHKYIEKYPERFDNAQRLIRTIMTRRQRYSVLTERAIKSSTDNPEDHETPSKIILEMKTLEKNPPEEIQVVITMLEDLHLFKYYAYLFDTIQTESSDLARKNDVISAISKVQEGFWVYKDEFTEQWKNQPAIIKEAARIEEQLNKYIVTFENQDFRRRMNNAVNAFVRNVDDNRYEAASENFKNVQQIFTEYSQIRNNIYKCLQDYRALYQRQQRIDPEITDASYIPFMMRFVSGVPSIPDSGIIGAIDCEWSIRMEQMKTSVAKMTTKQNANYLAALPKTIMDPAADLSAMERPTPFTAPIANYAELGKKVNNLYGLLQKDGGKTYDPYPQYNKALDYAKSISSQTGALYSVASTVKKQKQIQDELRAKLSSKETNASQSTEYVRQLFDSVAKMDKALGNKQRLLPTSSEGIVSDNCSLDWNASTNKYVAYVDELFTASQNAVISSWKDISQSFIDNAASYESVIKEYNQYAQVFHTGFSESIDEKTYNKLKDDPEALLQYAKTHPNAKQNEVAYVYPELTLVMTDYMKSVSQNYENAMSSAQQEFDFNMTNHPEWNSNRQITDIVSNSRNYMNRKTTELNNLKQSVSSVIASATQDTQKAKEARNQADDLYQRSVSAFNRGQYETAENLLVQSSEKYTESLSFQDDSALRSSVDKKQFELSQKITDARNEIVVRESRALYTKARDAQTIDRYDDAELFINQAITKWAETHEEKNDEFEDFRNLVNTAVSMKTGRILLVSDPLYAEMSQLLSIAYQYYDEGKECYAKNDKEKGDEALALALENLTKIKKVYPINQEASILMLKIDQLQDPAKFKTEFGEKIKAAVAKCKISETQTEGYNELMTYYSLEPDYKGLKDTIYNIEIQLGMRQKPVDNSAVARSRRLTNEAQSLYNSAGNNTATLNRALARVKEALQVNPNNSAAEQLRDRIETRLGGTTNIVLSSADQSLLTRAKNEYQAGRIDEANLILLQILSNNPQNIKVKTVADLKKKIDARL